MKYSKNEVLQYVAEEDVKFIRMAFCDIYGQQKNISIMPQELEKAFEYGIAIDASAIKGFNVKVHSDLFLHPDPSTISVLPWRPEHGRVVRMFCNITYPNGKPFECDTRTVLINAVEEAKEMGLEFSFGSEMEFYLFNLNENGEKTVIPYDNAGYMDIAPDDKGENIRREICLTLEQMGIIPESSHHEEGPGQNEIDFRYSDPLTAADNAVTFKSVVKTAAARNGLYADFSPKPLLNKAGNGMHINFSVAENKKSKINNLKDDEKNIMQCVIAGILDKINDITLFLNITDESYLRFGHSKAPKYVTWSNENRSELIRIPAAFGKYKRAELRSADPMCNPYLAFALIIKAGIYGVKNNLKLPKPADFNLYLAEKEKIKDLKLLPLTLAEAKENALNSLFIKENLNENLIKNYTQD